MAFSFDSLGALVLLAVAIWSWRMAGPLRAKSRVPLRFAAVLLAALAVSLWIPVADLALNVALFAASGAGAAQALAFCFSRGAPPWVSGVALALGFAFGLAASLAAQPVLALAFQGAAAACILAASFSRFRDNRPAAIAAMFGALSLLSGGFAVMDGATAQATLFYAAALGLVSRASQLAVEEADARIKLPIRGKHA